MNITITSTPFYGWKIFYLLQVNYFRIDTEQSRSSARWQAQCSVGRRGIPVYLAEYRSLLPCASSQDMDNKQRLYIHENPNRLFVNDLYLLISGKNRDPVVGNCCQGGDCYNGKSHLLSQFFFANVLSDYLSVRLIPVRNSMGVTPNFFRKSRWNVCTVDMPHDLAIASIV